MHFNRHSDKPEFHAFLAPSKYHWMNYDEEKLERVYTAHLAARKGDELHAVAAELIRLRIRQERVEKTFNMYVNDAIGLRMTPEQKLWFSVNAFGTADAIAFKDNKLRIHDLKTGVTPTSVKQLYAYAALFCLEYLMKPSDIEFEFRIYQNDERRVYEGDPLLVLNTMDTLISHDRRINEMREELGV